MQRVLDLREVHASDFVVFVPLVVLG